MVELLNISLLKMQALVEFFGTLSSEWAMECMKDLLLVNLRGNLQIIVQVSDVLLYYMKFVFFNMTLTYPYHCRLARSTASNLVLIHALNSLSSSSLMKGYTFS